MLRFSHLSFLLFKHPLEVLLHFLKSQAQLEELFVLLLCIGFEEAAQDTGLLILEVVVGKVDNLDAGVGLETH